MQNILSLQTTLVPHNRLCIDGVVNRATSLLTELSCKAYRVQNKKHMKQNKRKISHGLVKDLSKLVQQHPHNPFLHEHFSRMRTEYKQMKKREHNQYFNSLLSPIDNLNGDSRRNFQKTIDNLKEKGTYSDPPNIPVYSEHFRNLEKGPFILTQVRNQSYPN